MKSIFFRDYILLALILTAAVILAAIFKPNIIKFEIALTTLGGIFSSVFFVQKQKLEELKLFKDLFTEFNHRYYQMNEKLKGIRLFMTCRFILLCPLEIFSGDRSFTQTCDKRIVSGTPMGRGCACHEICLLTVSNHTIIA